METSTFTQIYEAHRARYPKMEAQDLEKLRFQSIYGGEHLITDEAACLRMLKEEWRDAAHDGRFHAPSAPEDIGGGHLRFPLCAISDDENAPFALRALWRLFLASARLDARGCSVGNAECARRTEPAAGSELRTAANAEHSSCAERTEHAPDADAANASGGRPQPVHHSEAFRTAYHPAYRVLQSELLPLLPLLSAVERMLSEKSFCVLSIDGRCGSGKTSLAAFLQSVYGCSVLHADDFFLPPELHTKARLSEPGGNIHYERLYEEVICPLTEKKRMTPAPCARKQPPAPGEITSQKLSAPGDTLTFRRFSCAKMAYEKSPVQLKLTPLFIVEGSYCQLPALCSAYDLRVFLTCPEAVQRARIEKRNGTQMLQTFLSRWIPMEERYFSRFQIAQHADFVLGA